MGRTGISVAQRGPSPGKETADGIVFGQCNCPAIGLAGLRHTAKTGADLRTDCPIGLVLRNPLAGDRIKDVKGRIRASGFGQGRGKTEPCADGGREPAEAFV